MNVSRLSALVLTLFLLFPSASADRIKKRQDGYTPGVVWVGGQGTRETTAAIMQREQALAPRGPQAFFEIPEHEVERPSMAQNPFSPAVSSWPPLSARGPNGPAASRPPLLVHASFFTASFKSDSFNSTPPDPEGAPGLTNYLFAINQRIRSYSKTGIVGVLNTTFDNFFVSIKGGKGVADPRVRFDRFTNRWFVSCMTGNIDQPNDVLIAVSSDEAISAATTWQFFKFQTDLVGPTPNKDTGAFFDQPNVGLDKNALYIGGWTFKPGLLGSTVFVIRKSSLLGAGPIVVTAFRDLMAGSVQGVGPPCGIDNEDPAATKGFIIGPDFDNLGRLVMRTITDPGGSPAISGDQFITVPTTAEPRGAVAMGSTSPLDTGGYRITHGRIRTNRLTGQTTLWVNHPCKLNSSGVAATNGDRVGMRWYNISVSGAAPTLIQSGTVFDGAASNPANFYQGSIEMTGQGHTLIGCNASGVAERANIAVARRLGTDALGTMPDIKRIKFSAFDYSLFDSGREVYRWGDYTNTVIDPADDMTIWTVQEFADQVKSWGVQVMSIYAPPAPPITSATPPDLPLGATLNVEVLGDTSKGGGFFDPGPAYAKRLAAKFSAAGVTVNSVLFVNPGRVRLNVTVAPNATLGSITLTVTNGDGQAASKTLTVAPADGLYPAKVELAPAQVKGGVGSTATITLNKVAPSGAAVTTDSSDPSVATVANAAVLANQSSCTAAIKTFAVAASKSVQIGATMHGFRTATTLVVTPSAVKAILFSANPLVGSKSLSGQLQMDDSAPAGGETVTLTSNPSFVLVPNNIPIAQGATSSAVFTISTKAVASTIGVPVTSSFNGVTRTEVLTLVPAWVLSIAVSPLSVVGGVNSSGKLVLNGNPPPPGVNIPLDTDVHSAATVPASVAVSSSSASSLPFAITTKPVAVNTDVVVSSVYQGKPATARITVRAPSPYSFTLTANQVGGGSSVTGRVRLDGYAAVGGCQLSLTSSNGAAAFFDTPNAIVSAGTNIISLTVKTNPVAANKAVTLSATANGVTKSVVLNVHPATVLNAEVQPNPIFGGMQGVGTVYLDGIVAAGVTVIVTISSDNPNAQVSSPVTIPAGSSSASFTVNTVSTGQQAVANIVASVGGKTVSTTLQIYP